MVLYVADAQHEDARAVAAALQSRLVDVAPGAHEFTIVEVLSDPRRASQNGVFAPPTIVREDAPEQPRVFGDLSDPVAVLRNLGVGKV